MQWQYKLSKQSIVQTKAYLQLSIVNFTVHTF